MFLLLNLIIYIFVSGVSILFQLIKLPFSFVQEFANEYPLQTARSIVGFITGILVSSLLSLPHEFGISFSVSIISIILGEIL